MTSPGKAEAFLRAVSRDFVRGKIDAYVLYAAISSRIEGKGSKAILAKMAEDMPEDKVGGMLDS